MRPDFRLRPVLTIALLMATASVAVAQVPADTTPGSQVLRGGAFAGSALESRLRTLQLLRAIPAHQWSIRQLGPRELERLTLADSVALPASLSRPWCAQQCDLRGGRSAGVSLLPAEASVWFNSTHPFGINDGPVWAGRGVTTAVSAAVSAHAGPLSLVLAPIATWSQNAAFALEPNGQTDELRFADAFFFDLIDHPQRFGDAPVTRIDPGESTLRLDLLGAAAGMSTASQWWGPMSIYPFLLSNNAGGFPHVFAGTSRPANIGIGRLHARVIYGDLAQSAYSIMPDAGARRFASGVVAVFMPRGLPGLEVGGGRFYHSVWPSTGLTAADFRKPFEGLLKESSVGRNPDGSLLDDPHNQLASVFARLVLPNSGVEVYGEFGREDHNA
ncbi:MAG: hypothetical protein H0X64_03140, partial [Gemmatimonadaceae bacterium]|nr:hypothetical protein [Gemmatimonadaceae bacterium]